MPPRGEDMGVYSVLVTRPVMTRDLEHGLTFTPRHSMLYPRRVILS